MTDQPQQTNPNEHRYYPEDEVELIDYLLVIWKWKYLILAGTLAFAVTAAIISFITWKPQPQKYRTDMVLKPGILKLDSNRNEVFIASLAKLKILIENDLKDKILNDIKTSNNTNLLTSLEFQVSFKKNTGKLNVSLKSASVEEGATNANLMIKALFAWSTKQIKYIQERYEKVISSKKIEREWFKAENARSQDQYLDQIEINKKLLAELKEKETIAGKKIENRIEIKKKLLAELKEKEAIARNKNGDNLQLIKIKLDDLLFEEKRIENQIENYQQRLSALESNINRLNESTEKMLKENKILNKNIDINNIHKSFLIEGSLRDAANKIFERNQNAKNNLVKIQNNIADVSKRLKDFQKTIKSNQVDPILQPGLYKIQKDIVSVSKEIENFQRIKESNQVDPILQPELYKIHKDILSVSKKIEKFEKGKNNIQDDFNYGPSFARNQRTINKISIEIEELEKEKLNIQNMQIVQSPITTELHKKKSKINRNIILSSIVGLFVMIFLSFLLEYLPNIKNMWIKKQLEIKNE